MELIFILTYNCNYRCRYCDIDKRAEDMNDLVIRKSLDFLSNQNISFTKTKFFGGEPTMKFQNICTLIDGFPRDQNSKFYVTTNGSLLDTEKIIQMKARDMIVTLSLDGDKKTTDENRFIVGNGDSKYMQILANIFGEETFFRVNQVITPKNVSSMVENFEYLYSLGFRSFNFLPEYYVEWSKDSLKLLVYGFQKIQEMRSQKPIFLVNSENYSPTSFFNFGIVIDTDGSLYGTNLILAGRFEKYKSELKIGSVFDADFSLLSPGEQLGYLEKIQTCLEKEYSHNILKSVFYVNQILSNFTIQYDQ